jgi:dTDP-4-dehydrorhamnose reductase
VISWYEFATAIKEITGSECVLQPVSTSEFPTVATRPAFSVMDKTKIQETFGIKLKDWKESLNKCIEKIKNAS